MERATLNRHREMPHPIRSFVAKLQKLDGLIQSHPVPCDGGCGGVASKVVTRNQHVETVCAQCAAARTPLERRARRNANARSRR